METILDETVKFIYRFHFYNPHPLSGRPGETQLITEHHLVDSPDVMIGERDT